MFTATFEHICSDLRRIWPRLPLIWPTDRKYIRPEIEDVMAFLQTIELPQINPSEAWDCDDRALETIAATRRHVAGVLDLKIPWAVGFTSASRLNGLPMDHTLVLADCADAVWLINPPTINSPAWKHWKATNEKDDLLAVFI